MRRQQISAFLDEVEAKLAADLPELEQRADELLGLYRGIPTRTNVFDVLNLIGNEDRHTDFLAWLLDPARDHGLGDGFLRRFLAMTGAPTAVRAARRNNALRAAVRTRFSLPGGGIPDLAVVVPGSPTIAILCEAKVHAGLTYSLDRTAQTTTYRRWVEQHGARAFLDQLGPLPFRIGVQPLEMMLLFLRASEEQLPEPEGEGQEDGARRWRTVEYSSIERVLGRMERDMDLESAPRSLIQQYRTSILEGGLPGREPLTALRRLRLLRDIDAGRGRSHMRALRLRRLLDSLQLPGGPHD